MQIGLTDAMRTVLKCISSVVESIYQLIENACEVFEVTISITSINSYAKLGHFMGKLGIILNPCKLFIRIRSKTPYPSSRAEAESLRVYRIDTITKLTYITNIAKCIGIRPSIGRHFSHSAYPTLKYPRSQLCHKFPSYPSSHLPV